MYYVHKNKIKNNLYKQENLLPFHVHLYKRSELNYVKQGCSTHYRVALAQKKTIFNIAMVKVTLKLH